MGMPWAFLFLSCLDKRGPRFLHVQVTQPGIPGHFQVGVDGRKNRLPPGSHYKDLENNSDTMMKCVKTLNSREKVAETRNEGYRELL